MIRTASISERALATVNGGAVLPQTYEYARQALANCASIDECQSWADKAAALASYAKQAKDEELMKMAVRIRDRAIRRTGELLKQIEPGKTGPKLSTDTDTQFSRKQAANDAGLSKRQKDTAINMANVPQDQFDEQVESDNPPSATKLAAQGRKSAPKPVIDLGGRDPNEFNRAMHFVGAFEAYQRDIARLDPDAALPILVESERERIRKAIGTIDAFHDRIITRI